MTESVRLQQKENRGPAYKPPVWAGVGYPLPNDGSINIVIDHEAINSSLRILLQIEPGDLIMDNSYGTPLRDLLFEQENPGLEEEIALRVALSIQRWEPRIVILEPGIEVGVGEESYQDPTGACVIAVRFSYALKSNISTKMLFDTQVTRQSNLSSPRFLTGDAVVREFTQE